MANCDVPFVNWRIYLDLQVAFAQKIIERTNKKETSEKEESKENAGEKAEIESLEAQKQTILHPVTMRAVLTKIKEAGYFPQRNWDLT